MFRNIACTLQGRLAIALLLLCQAYGLAQAQDFQVSTDTLDSQYGPAIAMDSAGRFVVVWDDRGRDGQGFGVFGRRYDALGAPQGDDFQVNTTTAGDQLMPDVALDSAGNFVVVWTSYYGNTIESGIFAQKFDSDGLADGAEFQVSAGDSSQQIYPNVSLNDAGEFVVVWTLFTGNNDSDAVGQRFDAMGPVGGEFVINTHTRDYQSLPSVAIDVDGGFVVVWDSTDQVHPSNSAEDIFARLYDSDGVAAASEFLVNVSTAESQRSARVARDGAGDFVVVWDSYTDGIDDNDVLARRFDSTGSPKEGEFLVNTYTTSAQKAPDVAMDGSGRFLVTWQSQSQDGSPQSVFAQRFDGAGMLDGAEFPVTTYTTGNQIVPTVAMHDDGRFVVAWTDTARDGSLDGVFGRYFANDSDGDGYSDGDETTNCFPPSDPLDAGSTPVDTDGDLSCDTLDLDDDNDGVEDGSDNAPLDPNLCQDLDGDTCDDCSVVQPPDTANDGLDTDGDGACDEGDTDDDNDGVDDGSDSAPLDPSVCQDLDGDTCDDCSVVQPPDTANDGPDADGDGICDAADGDSDGDGYSDDDETLNCSPPSDPLDAGSTPVDTDGDLSCDTLDLDDDNDGVDDGSDSAPLDPSLCQDLDGDICDDCSQVQPPDTANDGLDTDGDGACDEGDTDDDNDGVDDGSDSAPLDPSVCQDLDGDICDDCSVVQPPDTANDGLDTDGDGACDEGDTDDDNDGVDDGSDNAPLDPSVCQDLDGDTCDDCSVVQPPDTANDGLDTDGDGACDEGDTDDDNDGVDDGSDSAPLDPSVCQDLDGDTCDDCSVVQPPDTANDGLDTDGDGACDEGDTDDDNDGVDDGSDNAPLDPSVCQDLDGDTCDDCSQVQPPDGANDGLDTDGDGACDEGDTDDDNDGVDDGSDSAPLDPSVCQDLDGDTCDDCSVVQPPDTANDGPDADGDGICDAADGDSDGDGYSDDDETLNCSPPSDPLDAGSTPVDTDGDLSCDTLDLDDDNDGVDDGSDSAPLDPNQCQDLDGDTCDDCSQVQPPDGANDGLDTDGDGACDEGDTDDDNDGVDDGSDSAPLDPSVCQDLDGDTCDDCSVVQPPDTANDGPDADGDGICDAADGDDDGDGYSDDDETLNCSPPSDPLDAGSTPVDTDGDLSCDTLDLDDDNDGVDDGSDSARLDPNLCQDLDGDTCDDCSQVQPPDTANDGPDADGDGICDAADGDDDGDGYSDDDETINCSPPSDPLDAGSTPVDTDGDLSCDTLDLDDDNDGVDDGSDNAPLDPSLCQDLDGDTCDDCSVVQPPDTANDGPDADGNGICDAGEAPDTGNQTAVAICGTTAHYAWVRFEDSGTNPNIFYRSCELGGACTAPLRLVGAPTVEQSPAVACDGDTVIVLWEDHRNGTGDIAFRRNPDGAGFDALEFLVRGPNEETQPQLVMSGDVVIALWVDTRRGNNDLGFRRSTDRGAEWSTFGFLVRSPFSETEPSLALDENTAVLSWVDRRHGNQDVAYRRSANAGEAWQGLTFLVRAPTRESSPTTAVDGSTGTVLMGWMDSRNGVEDLAARRSEDHGVVFQGLTFMVRAATDDLQPGLSVSGDTALLVWVDTRDVNRNISYRLSGNAGVDWGNTARLVSAPTDEFEPACDLLQVQGACAWSDTRTGAPLPMARQTVAGGDPWQALFDLD